MCLNSPRTVIIAVSLSCLAMFGCQDHRIDEAPEAPRDVHVVAPGADVKVQSDPLIPHSGGVDVNVGPGGVKVDVDGEPLRERIRERRAAENVTP